MSLLGHSCLVAYRLPVSAAADPDTRVAIWAAEILAELVTLHVGTRGHDGSVAVNADHHVGYIDRLVAELAALARGYRIRFGGNLAQWCDGDVVLGEGTQGKVSITLEAGLFGLAFHVDDLTNGFLFARIETGPGM